MTFVCVNVPTNGRFIDRRHGRFTPRSYTHYNKHHLDTYDVQIDDNHLLVDDTL